jgi:hypothetical protein
LVPIAASALLGCTSLFGPSGYPIGVELLALCPTGPLAEPVVDVRQGEVSVVVEESFGDPGYRIRANAAKGRLASAGGLEGIGITVITQRLGGDVTPMQVCRRYRLTVSAIPGGTYALRLRWRNDFHLPEFRRRILVDTVVAVP